MAPEEILKDDYSTEEEKRIAQQLLAFQNQAQEGALWEDWMRHPCGKKFSEWMEREITDAKNKVLTAEDLKAVEEIRVAARAYIKLKQYIASQILGGKVAADGIKKFHEEGAKLEGLIKDQSPKQTP